MRILVCSQSGIGNAITASPLVSVLKNMGHEVSVKIASNRHSKPIFEGLGVANIYDENSDIPRHDLACCTHVCAHYHNETCGYAEKHYMIEPGQKDSDYYSIHRYIKHEYEHNIDLARKLGYLGNVPPPMLPLKPFRHGLDVKKGSNVIVGIGHLKGDGNSELKHWGNGNFAELCALLRDAGHRPIILGGPDDKANAAEIVSMFADDLDVYTDLELGEAFWLLTECGRCITNETMLVPASYARAKCLSLIFKEALNNPQKTFPYRRGTALLGYKADITPQVVMDSFNRLLADGPWTTVHQLPDATIHINASPTSKLHCIRQGFGAARPKVSIVGLLCDFGEDEPGVNSEEMIGCLRATAPDDCEIILVANAPSERLRGVIDTAENADSRIISVAVSQNVGVVAKNLGYNMAQGEIVLSVDGDVFVEPGWVDAAVSAFIEPDVGIIGPCGGRLSPRVWNQAAWGCGDFSKGPRTIFGYEDVEYFGNQTTTGVDGTELDVIPSMLWGVRREVFDKVGYLDWRFGPFVGSDSDFCLRAKLAGYRVVLKRVPMRHKNGGGSSHRYIVGMGALKENHIRALHNRWWGFRTQVCELCKNNHSI